MENSQVNNDQNVESQNSCEPTEVINIKTFNVLS